MATSSGTGRKRKYRKKTGGGPRMTDVARLAGVSPATVSHALRGGSTNIKISEETIARVKAAAAELNYVINPLGRALRLQKTRTLGFILCDILNPFSALLARHMSETAFEKGYDLLFIDAQYDQTRFVQSIRNMVEQHVAGLVITPMENMMDLSIYSWLGEQKTPFVLTNHLAGLKAHSVTVNNRTAARTMARHLLSLGHRRIAYIGNAMMVSTDRARLEGLRSVLLEADCPLPERYIIESSPNPDEIQKAVSDILNQTPPPDALVAFSDIMAIAVIQQIHKLGRRIPEDIAVVGFDNIILASIIDPPLTTMALPEQEIAKECVNHLIEMIEGKKESAGFLRRVLNAELIVRQSCGAKGAMV